MRDDFQSNGQPLRGWPGWPLAGLNQRKWAGVCVALVGASDRVPACDNVPSMRRGLVCASTITSVGAAWREAWFGCGGPFSRALQTFATVSGRCLHSRSTTTYLVFNADWTPRERPSWRTRIRWRSTGRRSSRLVDFTFVLLCYCCCSRDVSLWDAQHLSGGFHVSTSASSSRPYNMIASYKSFCSLLATFLLRFSFQRNCLQHTAPTRPTLSPIPLLSNIYTTYTPSSQPTPRKYAPH